MTIKLLSFFLLTSCFACTTPAKITGQQPTGQLSPETKTEPEIGFFSFKIYKQANDNYIELAGQKIVKGVVKDNTSYIKNPSATLTADFFENDLKVTSITIDHPLQQVYEVVKEDKTTIEPVTSNKDSSSFFLRVQLDKKITSIRFSEVIDHKQRTLNTIKL